MDVHRLRVLRAVVAAGSVHGAATTLGYTASAISQHLTALQRETGLPLVQRAGRGIEPTAAGRAVADAAAGLFHELAELDALVADLRSGRDGALSVSYFASAGSAWIPGVVAAVTRDFPRLRLDLRLLELTGPDAGAPDIEIAVDDGSGGGRPGYRCRPLVTEPYFAVVRAGSPLAGRADVDLVELRSEPWVDNDVARGPCRQALLDACTTAGFSPTFHIETQDYPTAIRFVAAGVGVTVVPRLALLDLPPGVVAVPIVNPTPRRSISVQVAESMVDNLAAVRILELLADQVDAWTQDRRLSSAG
ncbi:LysR family transcriptional regulator [Nakamurella flava]|uniref:LysR family transcriptional regulator n=1 Tax=Nakamurella flava TaxID=2576308 RepID=A0A4U6QJQ5_9ACTN|nr:LysR family transcriptional regulator [Nakamurella flava]TKV60673.1 LysR family transcriptional regulator [Nakamurella flava]